jgi:hypothetical protein
MLIRTRTREGSRTKSLTHRWLRRPVARVLALFVPDLETLGWLRTLAMACVDTASGAVIADSIGRAATGGSQLERVGRAARWRGGSGAGWSRDCSPCRKCGKPIFANNSEIHT